MAARRAVGVVVDEGFNAAPAASAVLLKRRRQRLVQLIQEILSEEAKDLRYLW